MTSDRSMATVTKPSVRAAETYAEHSASHICKSPPRPPCPPAPRPPCPPHTPCLHTGASQSFVLYMAVANATDVAVNTSFKNDTLAMLAGRFNVPDTAHRGAAIAAASNLSALEPGIYISNITAASFPTLTQAGGSQHGVALNAVAVTFDLVVPLQVGRLEARGAPH